MKLSLIFAAGALALTLVAIFVAGLDSTVGKVSLGVGAALLAAAVLRFIDARKSRRLER